MGENLRIVRLASLDGGMGRCCQCWGRKAVRDKEGEGMRVQETKHSVGENIRILRLTSLDSGRGHSADAVEEKLFETKRGRG